MDRVEVERLINEGSWQALFTWASALDGEDLQVARKGYRSSFRALARKRATGVWGGGPARSIQIGLAVALADTPEEASKNCAWGREFGWGDADGVMPVLGDLLVRRGKEWVAEFVALSTQVRLKGEAARGASEITALTCSAISAYDLSVPASGTYAQGWVQLVHSAQVATQFQEHAWRPIRIPRSGPGEHADSAYSLPSSLYAELLATPRLQDTLRSALATANSFVEWHTLTGGEWEIEGAFRRLIAEGKLDRQPVVTDSLAALTRADKPSAQRVMAKLLNAAAFGPADIQEHRSLVTHVMATAHGSVTAVLLAAVLTSEPDDDLLAEIGPVMLTRTEKAQKSQLLKHLLARPRSAVVDDLLAIAAKDSDSAFAGKARAASASSPSAAPTEPTCSWTVDAQIEITGRTPGAFPTWAPDVAGLDAAQSDMETWVRITSESAWLDLAVRFAHRDISGLRAAVQKWPPIGWYSPSRIPPLLQKWAAGEDWTASDTLQTQMSRMDPVTNEWIQVPSPPTTHRPPAHEVFTDRLTEETLGRLGEIPELLSTPCSEDGMLSFDCLVDRLRRAQRHGAGPHDLVQALLRLDVVPGNAVGRLDGIRVELAGKPQRRLLRRSPVKTDAVDVVRGWIQGGGVPDRQTQLTGATLAMEGVALPLPDHLAELDGLAELCGPIVTRLAKPEHFWMPPSRVAHYLGVSPYWSDAAATQILGSGTPDSVDRVHALEMLVDGAGRFGTGAHYLFATTQSHGRQDSRLAVADAMVRTATEGRLDAQRLRSATVAAYEAGALSVSRLGNTWEAVVQAGGVRWIWPSAVAVLDLACSAHRKPAGLADLLRALSPAVATMTVSGGADALPLSVRRLAAEKGSTKTIAEARTLVAIADGSKP